MLYFRTDVRQLTAAWFDSVFHGRPSADSRLAWGVVVGTVPVAVFGLIVNDWLVESLRQPLVIAAANAVFGVLLWWADRSGPRLRDEHSLNMKQAFYVGLAQALSLIPGTSRSGITITAGLMLGLTRKAASRFSFLLSMPVIILAGAVKLTELLRDPEPVSWLLIGTGTVLSGVVAYLSIHYFLSLIDRIGMAPFAIYRIALALLLLYVFL